MLQQEESLFRIGRCLEQLIQQKTFIGGRSHFGDEDRVVGGDKRLRLVREHGVHRVARFVREGEYRVERVVVIQQQIRTDAVNARVVGATALAFVLIDVDTSAGNEFPVFRAVVRTERRDRRDHELLRCFVRISLFVLVDRHEPVVKMIGFQPEQAFAELGVALQRRGAGTHCCDQRLDDRRWYRIAIERAAERSWVVTCLGGEPVTLHHTVVNRGVGVGGGRVGLKIRLESFRSVRLVVIRFQYGLINTGCERDLLAVGKSDGRKFDVRRAQFLEGCRGSPIEPRCVRQQLLTLFIEHVRLLAVVVEDAEAIRRQRGRLGQPLFHRRLRDGQELGRKPRRSRSELGKDRADALEFSGDILIARIDVALQLRIAIDLVLKHTDFVITSVRL